MANIIDYREIVQTVMSDVLTDVKSQLAAMQPGMVDNIVKKIQSSLPPSLDSCDGQLDDTPQILSEVERNSSLVQNVEIAAGFTDFDYELDQALKNQDLDSGKEWRTPEEFGANRIVEGVITRVENEFVLVDIGAKSEGAIKRDEWGEDEELPQVGQRVKALVEEDEESEKPQSLRNWIMLSKRNADKIEAWENVLKQVHVGDVVEGIVSRKIRGGLLVDVGVNVFLPEDQVEIHRTNITDFIGKTVQCVVQRIDEVRRTIYVSRRALLEEELEEQKSLSERQNDSSPVSNAVNTTPTSPKANNGSKASSLLLLIQNWPHIVHDGWILYSDQENGGVYMVREDGTDKTDIRESFGSTTPDKFISVVENGSDWVVIYDTKNQGTNAAVVHIPQTFSF